MEKEKKIERHAVGCFDDFLIYKICIDDKRFVKTNFNSYHIDKLGTGFNALCSCCRKKIGILTASFCLFMNEQTFEVGPLCTHCYAGGLDADDFFYVLSEPEEDMES